MVSQESIYPDGEYEEVVEGNHATATYSSFLKNRHAFSWGLEETRLFYQVSNKTSFCGQPSQKSAMLIIPPNFFINSVCDSVALNSRSCSLSFQDGLESN